MVLAALSGRAESRALRMPAAAKMMLEDDCSLRRARPSSDVKIDAFLFGFAVTLASVLQWGSPAAASLLAFTLVCACKTGIRHATIVFDELFDSKDASRLQHE